MDSNMNKGNKALLFSIVGVLTLIVAIAGSTYAFFAVSATNTSEIKGGSAYDPNTLNLTVEQKSAGTGELVPQLDTAIQKAVTGTNGSSCIDGNGNTICKVYEIVITNTSTVKLNVSGTLTLTAAKMTNLKWAKGTSATSGFPVTDSDGTTKYYATESGYDILDNTKVNSALADVALAAKDQAGDSATFYVVVWISETGTVDKDGQTDEGEFAGTVTFTGYIAGGDGTTVGGISSTIRG